MTMRLEKKCEFETPKIIGVLDSIGEVMNWIERVLVDVSIFYICKTVICVCAEEMPLMK
jgi:hypothetical protein